MRKIIVSVLVLAVLVVGTLFAMQLFWPGSQPGQRPALAPVPALEPVTRSSTIVAPVSVAHSAIRNALNAQAPKKLKGEQDKLDLQALTNANVIWTVDRGPFSVATRNESLMVSAPLTGTARLAGQISEMTGDLVGALGGLLDQGIGQNLRQLTGQTIRQEAGFTGNVIVTSRPALTPNWRIEPNLSGQVSMARAALMLAGIPIEVRDLVKPVLDQSIREKTAEFEAQLRNSPMLEHAVRREWTKLCQSIPLNQAGDEFPDLWLEVKPTRAFAAQPRLARAAVVLNIGVQAETRIVPSETKPQCPFPRQLELVRGTEKGRVSIAVPIDMPFTHINKLLQAQLSGKVLPENQSGPVAITVKSAELAASGDRLLISLRVKAEEGKSWLGLTDDADIYVWGRPVLDTEQQTLRLTDMEVDVQSQAAFGLLGKAAQATLPLFRDTLAEMAVIDLKPFIADAKTQIAAAVSEFSRKEPGFRVEAAATDVRLVDIAFDAKTLRVIAEVNGTAKVAISSLKL